MGAEIYLVNNNRDPLIRKVIAPKLHRYLVDIKIFEKIDNREKLSEW